MSMKIHGAAVVLALSLAVVACGVTEPSVDDQPAPSVETPTTTEATQSVAKVGDSLELAGMNEGEKMTVTVVKVVDPAEGKDEIFQPQQGMRFVAVQFRLRNTGTAVYDDSPGNGAALVDSEGQSFSESLNETSAGPSFAGSVTTKPGSTALGFITFEVPKGSKVAKIQFTLDSGMADETGEWVVS